MNKLSPRQRQVLEFAGTYRIIVLPILCVFLFGTLKKRAGQIVQQLVDGGLLEKNSRGLGKRALAWLTHVGTVAIDCPKERASAVPKARNFDVALAVMWHAVMHGRPDIRLDSRDYARLWGDDKLALRLRSSVHLLSVRGQEPCVYRCVLASGSVTQVVAELRKQIAEAEASAKLRPWIQASLLRWLVFTDQQTKKASLEARLNGTEVASVIEVAMAPTTNTFGKFLHDYRDEHE